MPAALSALRRASSVSTSSVRKLVAVGIERLSFMKRASVAAGPRIGLASAPPAAARGRRAVALDRGLHVVLRHAPARAGARDGAEVDARARPPCARRPAWRSRRRCRPGRRGRALARVPAAAAGSCGAGRAGPGAMRHSDRSRRRRCRRARRGARRSCRPRARAARRRPCRSRSRRAGRRCDGVADLDQPLEHGALGDRVAHLREGDVDELGLLRRPASGAAGRPGCRAVGASPSTAISPSTAPTATVSSGSARILVSVPAAGEGTSVSTLSVETSTIGSSASTRSPTCLRHSRTVPSVTDSPIWGMVIWTVVVRVAIRWSRVTPTCEASRRCATARRKLWGWGFEDQQPCAEEVEQVARRRSRASRLRAGRGRAAAAARGRRAAGAADRAARARWRRSAAATRTSAPRTPTARPTATSCAPSAAASTTRPTWSPDPRDEGEVEPVLDWCADAGAAAIPYGGGTSVVGGVEPRVPQAAAVTIDLGGLDRVLEVDPVSRRRASRPAPPGRGSRSSCAARPDAAPLPAVVRVLDARRLDRHPRRRPLRHAVHAHRRPRRVGARAHAERRLGEPPAARLGRRAEPRPDADRLRGHPRRDHRGVGARAARPRFKASAARPLRLVRAGRRGGARARAVAACTRRTAACSTRARRR